jgi:hypothetical protein
MTSSVFDREPESHSLSYADTADLHIRNRVVLSLQPRLYLCTRRAVRLLCTACGTRWHIINAQTTSET